jgi:hypothetical protein
MADRHHTYRSEPQVDRGDPPTRRFGSIAVGFAALFAVTALVLAAFAALGAVTDATVETTTYLAVGALLFALLTVATARERAEGRRRRAEARRRTARRRAPHAPD